MKVNSLEVKNFANVAHFAYAMNGDSIVLKGKNGAGKSALLTAIKVALYGKSAFPTGTDYSRWIRDQDGVDSSAIELKLGDNRVTRIVTTVSITKQDLYLKVKEVDESGNPVPVAGGAKKFCDDLIGALSFDPVDFKSKSPRDKLRDVYAMCPGLEGKLASLDDEYRREQDLRSDINKDIKRLEGEYHSISFPEDTPDKPVDVADLAEKHSNAVAHENRREETRRGIDRITAEKESAEREVELLEEQLRKAKDRVETLKSTLKQNVTDLELTKENPFGDPEKLKEDLAGVQKINENVDKKRRKADVKEQIGEKKERYSQGLQKMKEIDQRRIQVIENAKLPVPGMSIDGGEVTYPDANFTNVPIDRLSTGQYWEFAVRLYAAQNPRLAFILIPNLNDLDRDNAASLVEVANKHGLQIVAEETVAEKNPVGIEIKLDDGKATDE